MNTANTLRNAAQRRFSNAVPLVVALVLSACNAGPASVPGASAASGAVTPPAQDAVLTAPQAAALFDDALRAEFDGDVWLAQERYMALAVQSPESRHGRAARHRVSGGLGLPVLVGGAGVMAAVAIPAFMKYTRRSKTVEATLNLRRVFDASVAFYTEGGPDGSANTARFPPSVGPTPDHTACVDGESVPFPPDAKRWAHPTWQALNFAVNDPSRYQYEYLSEGEGPTAKFTIRAYGDLDCNGVRSTFERSAYIDADGNVIGGAGLLLHDELE
jgi:hypothetical protein